MSRQGKTFLILSKRFMRPGVLIVVNFDALIYGHHANDFLVRRGSSSRGRYQLGSFPSGLTVWLPGIQEQTSS
jgi:hypothetical protein